LNNKRGKRKTDSASKAQNSEGVPRKVDEEEVRHCREKEEGIC